MHDVIETAARQHLARVLTPDIPPGDLRLDADMAGGYGLTSLNKVLLLMSACDATGVSLAAFTEPDVAAMRTLGDVIAALSRHAAPAPTPAPTPAAAPEPGPGWARLAATTLENDDVLLAPLAPADREALFPLAIDEEIWRYFILRIETRDDFDAFFDAALADAEQGRRVPYLVTDKRAGAAAGTMSFCSLAEPDGRLEIGWSWLGRPFRGRGVNHWAKYLMLEHAFGCLAAERVEFKTDALNERARRGLRNIGATEEGTLRSFNPMPGNRRRDAVFYSVLAPEWPGVRARLLAGPTAPAPKPSGSEA